MNLSRLMCVLVTGITMNLTLATAQAEDARSMLDGNLLAAEAGMVDLVMNASGEVVQIRVEECEQCDRDSYLPSRQLRIKQSGNPDFSGSLDAVDGRAGTVVLNRRSGMVEQIIFWAPRDDAGSEK